MVIDLDKIVIDGVQPHPPLVIFYGPGGVGKSTAVSDLEGALWIDCENGTKFLPVKRVVPTGYPQVLDIIRAVREKSDSYKGLVIDGIDSLERMVWDHVASANGVTNVESIPYGRGYKLAVTHWRDMLHAIEQVQGKGLPVVLIGHETSIKVEDPTGPTYDRISPRLHRDIVNLLTERSDAVVHARLKTATRTTQDGRTLAVGVGQQGGDRVFTAVGSPAVIAKNRLGIEAGEHPLSWKTFVSLMKIGG